ncbi:hypothetical protein RFI_33260, partial [Reticulomyxa filosa]
MSIKDDIDAQGAEANLVQSGLNTAQDEDNIGDDIMNPSDRNSATPPEMVGDDVVGGNGDSSYVHVNNETGDMQGSPVAYGMDNNDNPQPTHGDGEGSRPISQDLASFFSFGNPLLEEVENLGNEQRELGDDANIDINANINTDSNNNINTNDDNAISNNLTGQEPEAELEITDELEDKMNEEMKRIRGNSLTHMHKRTLSNVANASEIGDGVKPLNDSANAGTNPDGLGIDMTSQ